MQIKNGDYMVWYGSDTKTGQYGFKRPDPSGSALETLILPNGDDKSYSALIRTSGDFLHLGVAIAETHDMFIEFVDPDKNADFHIFVIHEAVRFVSRSAPKPE